MVNKGSPTPGRILDAAERLFAGEGVDGTTLSAVIEAAGARNKSAIAYHFGTKFDLLQAVIARHHAVIDADRDRMLDDLERRGRPTLDELVAAMVQPAAAMLETASGICYLQIQAALLSYPRRDRLPAPLRDPTSRLHRLNELMARVAGPDPAPDATRTLVVSIIFHGLADFSRTSPTAVERAEFVTELERAVLAILGRQEAAPAARRRRAR